MDKQFAGNYVRLVNKSRSLEQEVILKDKIIKNLQDYISILTNNPCEGANKTAEFYRQLVAEQNKKAAEGNNDYLHLQRNGVEYRIKLAWVVLYVSLNRNR